MNYLKTLTTCLFVVLLMAPAVDAKKRKKKARSDKNKAPQAASLRLELVDTGLLGLPFGKTNEGVIRWAAQRIEQAYEPRFKVALDAREHDKLKHRMAKEIEALRGQFVYFKGQITGFEASVVQGEFVPGAEESLLLFRDGGTDHYLFFSGGVLWKYARPLTPNDTFEVRLASWRADQGVPSLEKATGKRITVAAWRGLDFALRLEDRRLVSASDLMVLEWLKLEAEVSQRRKTAQEKAAADGAGDDLDSYIE